jgi:hypothetical protein
MTRRLHPGANLRTRRKGERISTTAGERILHDPATFVERLRTMNRSGVRDLPRAKQP